jgi:hypothetical protein
VSRTSRTPHRKRCCDFLVAVAGEARKLASSGAAWIAGDREQGAVGGANVACVEPAGEPLLYRADQFDECAQATVVLRLLGKVREPAGQDPLHQAEELAIGGDPHRRLTDGKADELRVCDLGRASGRAGTGYSSAKT